MSHYQYLGHMVNYALVLMPSNSITTLYVGPRLDKVPVADRIFSSSVDTVSIHRIGFSSVATFYIQSLLQILLRTLFLFLCEGSGQLIAK